MTKSIKFGRRSTADQVLAGVDLTGKHIIVTGCSSGLGLETLNAFAANGAAVIGMARSVEAASRACAQASPVCIPVGCDLSDFDSISTALDTIRGLSVPLDAIVANAAAANLPSLQTRYGIEKQFLTNHIGHFMLVNGIADLLRDGTARIVMVSGEASVGQTRRDGIMFDNLDGGQFYDPSIFYAQSKLANALYAKELSRRLAARGIAANSADPGAARTRIRKGLFTRLFAKTAARAAATQALLAASPEVSGITGECWSNCNIVAGNALLRDTVLARRLWDVSQEILDARSSGKSALPRAA
jgi:NAD(P)-dependent dehydrogenase (short-subunit alcohol dehydrogenase family)